MSFLARMLGRGPKRQPPERVPTDEVMPLHLFDDVSYLRGYTLFWTFRFDDVLDPDMLANSLSALFETEGWRKLGGRLRMRPDGKIEVHVPCPFTEERPPLHFTKEHFDIPISEHPLASRLPAAGAGPELFPGANVFEDLARGPGSPTTLDDYLYSDLPQFALHVITFENATIVSINFNHIVSDAMGLCAILKAWSLHLAGTPESVPKFKSVQDGMRGMYETPGTETRLHSERKITGWGFMAFLAHLIWDSWWIPYTSRIFYIPKDLIDRIVKRARDELADGVPEGQEAPFISDGDVMLAFSLRMAAYTLPESSTRTINLLMAVDPRTRIPSVFDPDAAYVQNAPSGGILMRSAPQGRDTSLGEMALFMRKSLLEQTTEAQLRAAAYGLAESRKTSDQLPIYGDPHGLLATTTNWNKAKFHKIINFGPAVVKRGNTSVEPGHPSYYHGYSFYRGYFSTSIFVIMGRDHTGAMWGGGDFPTHAWTKLMKFLEESQ